MAYLRIALAVWLMTAGVGAQEPPPAPEAEVEAARLVQAWIDAWNGLDGTDAAREALVALYEEDALHVTGPNRDQRGTVTYSGHAGIRTLATTFAAAHDRLAYRVETETANETSAQLVHVTPGPWGGLAVAVQIAAVYSVRETGLRYVTPGALFLQLSDGRIRRARVYLASDERAEVEPELRRRR